MQRVSQESLSLCLNLKSVPDGTPRVPMQNRQAPLSLLAKPLGRPPLICLGKIRGEKAGTLFRPPIRRDLGTAAAPGLPASICLHDPCSLPVVWEKRKPNDTKFEKTHAPLSTEKAQLLWTRRISKLHFRLKPPSESQTLPDIVKNIFKDRRFFRDFGIVLWSSVESDIIKILS